MPTANPQHEQETGPKEARDPAIEAPRGRHRLTQLHSPATNSYSTPSVPSSCLLPAWSGRAIVLEERSARAPRILRSNAPIIPCKHSTRPALVISPTAPHDQKSEGGRRPIKQARGVAEHGTKEARGAPRIASMNLAWLAPARPKHPFPCADRAEGEAPTAPSGGPLPPPRPAELALAGRHQKVGGAAVIDR